MPSCTCPGKVCSHCSKLLCHQKFHTSSTRSKDGLRAECKVCRQAYRQVHRETITIQEKRYKASHKEQIRESQKKRYHANKKRLEPARKEYWRNRGRYLQIAHREQDIEAYRQKYRNYYDACPNRHKMRKAQYYKRHPEVLTVLEARRRARKVQAGGKFTKKQWQELKAFYNYTCLSCGKKEPYIKLCADHVIALACRGSNSIENIQPLCHSCNSRKHTQHIDYRPTFRRQEI